MRKRPRLRMIFDLPPTAQMAIRLRALKGRMTTSEVITQAVQKVFPHDWREAEVALANDRPPSAGRKGKGS